MSPDLICPITSQPCAGSCSSVANCVMTEPLESPVSRETPQQWRVGRHYGIHVYEGDIPVATALTKEFAQQIVDNHNELIRIKSKKHG